MYTFGNERKGGSTRKEEPGRVGGRREMEKGP